MRSVIAAAAMLLVAAISPAPAQEWPARTVTVIVPFSAGGTADLFARLLTTHMQQKLGGSFIVENRAGAGGNIGAGAVAKAPNDGYTLLARHRVDACDQSNSCIRTCSSIRRRISSRSA